MLKHTISITCCFEVAVVALFLYYQAKKKARSRLNTRQKNLKGFIELFVGDLWLMFFKFRDHTMSISQKTLRMEKGYSVDFINYFMVVQTKTYTAFVPTTSKSICDWSLSKIVILDVETTFRQIELETTPLRVVVSYAYLVFSQPPACLHQAMWTHKPFYISSI